MGCMCLHISKTRVHNHSFLLYFLFFRVVVVNLRAALTKMDGSMIKNIHVKI